MLAFLMLPPRQVDVCLKFSDCLENFKWQHEDKVLFSRQVPKTATAWLRPARLSNSINLSINLPALKHQPMDLSVCRGNWQLLSCCLLPEEFQVNWRAHVTYSGDKAKWPKRWGDEITWVVRQTTNKGVQLDWGQEIKLERTRTRGCNDRGQHGWDM